jgi:predicted  nucleic acid-binding Zn-ribbon protein
MATKKPDPTNRMIAVLERIETELRGLTAEAKETNERLGRLETQGKRTNKRLGNLEVRLTGVEVPGIASMEQRVQRLEAAVFKTAAE